MPSKYSLLFFLSLTAYSAIAQENFIPLNRDIYNQMDESVTQMKSTEVGNGFHTSVKPYRYNEVKQYLDIDSLNESIYYNPSKKKSLLGRKLRKENLIKLDKGDFHITLDPLFNFEFGKELISDTSSSINTRGFILQGSIGEKFSFTSSFYENQGSFINYLDNYIRNNSIVPGQGYVKSFYTGFDYAMASGYISYTPSKYFNFQFGHDKNFFGDGYRSLLLSDNSFNYPFLKITTSIWKLKYINLYAQFQDVRAPHTYESGFQKKYGSFHYLSWNVTKRLSIGIFEAIIWQGADSSGTRGFDINYLNPIIFYRPIEFSVGSPDNALLGLNIKFKINNRNYLYGQLMLDEFKLNEVRSGDGWYANKQGIQVGGKALRLFGIPNLSFQTEYNYVRPYTYSHISPLQNYAHYNQPLAHPIGANFEESVSFVNYRYKSFYAELKFMYAVYGTDTTGLNFGKNPYISYQDHPNSYGNRVGQGLRTTLTYKDIRIGYIVNPKTNLNIEVGLSNRMQKTDQGEKQSNFLFFGIRTSLRNLYYDF